jgi:hypothetical protein
LAIWFGLLLLNLAVNQGWVGNVAYSSTHGFDRASNIWTGPLPAILWILAVMLPTLAVLADSPARREGFLATRPLPRRDLFLAKLLFVVGLIVAPWVLQEAINLIGQGAPGWVIERGTFERLIFVLPTIVALAAFAALWPSLPRWAGAVGIIFAGYAVSAFCFFLLVRYFKLSIPDFDTEKSHGLTNLYAMAAAITALAVWHSRAYRTAMWRWVGLILTLVLSQWIASKAPWSFFQWRPADPALAASTLAASGFEVPQRSISLSKEEDLENSGKTWVRLNINPETKPLPKSLAVGWTAHSAKLLHQSGGEIHGEWKTIGAKPLFADNPWNRQLGRADIEAWAPEFPPGILFSPGNTSEYTSSPSLYLNRFDYPSNVAELKEPLSANAGLEARVYQWRKIADLTMRAGASSSDEFGSWKFVALKPNGPPASKTWEIFLERRQINLKTASDSRCSGGDNSPLNRMVVMIYDPADQAVLMPDYTENNNADRGTETALPRYYVMAQFNELNGSLLGVDKDACRVVIFEHTWIGSVQEPWQSAPFTLDEKLEVAGGGRQASSQMITPEDFNQRAAALSPPPPGADRREAGRYLLQALQLVAAYRRELAPSEPLIDQMSRLVPEHLDLMLDVLPVASGAADSAMITAIELGATESQKAAILAALPQSPRLSSVVLKRGWTQDARPELGKMIQSPRILPVEAVRLMVALNDPTVYPALLDDFKRSPQTEKEELLRTVPGMEPKLKAIVIEQWRAKSLVVASRTWDLFRDPFILAMRYGDTSALQRVMQLLHDPDDSQVDGPLLSAGALATTVRIPGVSPDKPQDFKKVLPWLRQHRLEDFVFDATQRKFVLKANP